MSFPMMASYCALFGLWSITQFVLVSARRVASLCNELSDRFAIFCFALSVIPASVHERRTSQLMRDTPRIAAILSSKELRRVTFVRENITGVVPGAVAWAMCRSKT